mmetsp:Transcript_47934/g.113473  ORF Transcript_47934/g.113473 Transcript_47934/m.113473 type:complete len:211 (+) Transcript_47934:167-799(+)
MEIKYRDRSTLGTTGWCCCFFGFFVFGLVFGLTVLPEMNEGWQWTQDLCFVVEAHTCVQQLPPACNVSVDVLFDTLPICDERACHKRRGNVLAPDQTTSNQVWMFIHDVNTSHVCWQRAETMEVTFLDPNDMSNTEMILPFCLSAIFFIPSCLFIPAFMKQDSSAARLLDRMGIKHAPDHDQTALALLNSQAAKELLMRQGSTSIMMDNM